MLRLKINAWENAQGRFKTGAHLCQPLRYIRPQPHLFSLFFSQYIEKSFRQVIIHLCKGTGVDINNPKYEVGLPDKNIPRRVATWGICCL